MFSGSEIVTRGLRGVPYGTKFKAVRDIKSYMASLDDKFDFCIANVNYNKNRHYAASTQMLEDTTIPICFWIGHSLCPQLSTLRNWYPKEPWHRSVLPSYYEYFSFTDSPNLRSYDGSYMMLEHHHNKPTTKQNSDAVLYFPELQTTSETGIVGTLEKLRDMTVIMKLHPSIGTQRYVDSGFFDRNDYLKVCDHFPNVTIAEESTDLIHLMDLCSYAMSNYISSTLLEIVGRGAIYGNDKKVIVTKNDSDIPRLLGVNYNSTPDLSDFGTVRSEVLEQLSIPEGELIENFRGVILNELDSYKLDQNSVELLSNKYWRK
jgi:hypothetical protein